MRKYINAFTVKKYTGIFIIIAVVAVCSLFVKLTIAYLGDSDSKNNTVNVGYGDVSIDEKFDEPSELSMTNDITKQVQIQNKSTVPAFVRVYAEFSDSSIAEHAKVRYGTGENDICSWSDFKTKLGTDIASKWKYVKDGDLGGYFYYTEALSAVTYDDDKNPIYTETDKLFDSVTIDYNKYETVDDGLVAKDSNIDRIQPLEMIVYSELVQTVETGTTTVGTGENAKTKAF